MSDPAYTRLEWDKVDERYYETGVDRTVIYPMNTNGTYATGAAWSGVTNITENPDGAEPKDFYADNILYASLRSAEKVKGNIKAFTYPNEFAECDGMKEIVSNSGVYAKQQKRRAFGMTYRSFIGNKDDPEAAYKLHILYGLTVSPSERSHDTINEDPNLEEMSWDFEGVPEKLTRVTGFRPMASIELDSRDFPPTGDTPNAKLKAIEDALYGVTTTTGTNAVAGNAPTLLTPDEIYDILAG